MTIEEKAQEKIDEMNELIKRDRVMELLTLIKRDERSTKMYREEIADIEAGEVPNIGRSSSSSACGGTVTFASSN